MPDIAIVSTSERPDLVPRVARWLWHEFWRQDGYSFAQTLDAVAESVTANQMPRTFVLLADGIPVGTASLVAQDLETRRDLTPWLAGVFVEPNARRHGHANRLVAAVEAECRAISVSTLWLYTRTAERLYARAGWRTVEQIMFNGKAYALMRRDLCEGGI
jgi:N-acetylglutamate synthase-like GNAT family acetyltransferase